MPRAGKLATGLAILAVALAGAGAAAAVAFKDDRDSEATRLAEEEEEEQELEAQQEAEEEAQEEVRLERQARRTLVKDLERSITEDAQKEADKRFSIIDGPILDTQCDPSGGVIDTESPTQRFSCLAITNYTGGGGARGYRYSAEVNYNNFSYRWRLGGGGV